MPNFRKKPVVIKAVRYTGDNEAEIEAFVGPSGTYSPLNGVPRISTTEGVMVVGPGDWVIRGTRGEFYPCKPGPFADTFEPAD